jgi:phospholipid/cholesterol/gamma-HCH transport system ATP-binding protein
VTAAAKAGPTRPDADLDQEAPAIEVRDLVNASSATTSSMTAPDLDVQRGEVLGVVGGSGAGKSVLLNTIIGLKEPEGGTVKHLRPRPRDASRRRWPRSSALGRAVPAGRAVLEPDVRENVAAPLFEHTHLSRADRRAGRPEDRPGRPEAGVAGT